MNRKRIIILILFFIIIICIFKIINRGKNYEIEYKVDGYKVKEIYADKEYYNFKVNYKNKLFDYIYEVDDSHGKKIITNININKIDGYNCLELYIDKLKLSPICVKEDKYYSYNYVIDKINSNHVLKEVNKVKIYNLDYDFYYWNGFGFTNLNTNKKYNYLKNENFNNLFSYRINNYILFPNYDMKKSFNKLIVFNMENNKYFDITCNDFKISYDSYFIGDYEDNIYLFDKKNIVQYEISINKRKIEKVSNEEFGYIFDNSEKKELPLTKFVHKEIKFKNNNKYSYHLKDNKLYMNILSNKNNILLSKNKINTIIDNNNSEVLYLIDDKLYSYDDLYGEKLIAEYFEWNFNNYNKIYIKY